MGVGHSVASADTLNLIVIVHIESSQDGWRRLEYEEILAPAPPEESGAGLAGRKESCKYHLPTACHSTNQRPLQLEEKKKLDQLRKEKEEERQLQELQRMQEEQTGKKRTEKLEWMYTTPATGSNQNPNDLEDYLLGKKRVDKILTADENEKARRILSFYVFLSDLCPVGSLPQELHRRPECQHYPRYRLESSRGSVTCDEATGAGCLPVTDF